MSEALSIILSFTLSACAAALLRRMSPLRRSKLGVPFQTLPPLPGSEEIEPPAKVFIQIDSKSGDIVDAANRWRSKWHQHSLYLER